MGPQCALSVVLLLSSKRLFLILFSLEDSKKRFFLCGFQEDMDRVWLNLI